MLNLELIIDLYIYIYIYIYIYKYIYIYIYIYIALTYNTLKLLYSIITLALLYLQFNKKMKLLNILPVSINW